MTLGMYDASVPVLMHALQNLSNVLAKGAAHAKAKGTDEVHYTAMRLIPDMFPLSRQVQIACDVAKRGVAELAGVAPPVHPDTETSFAELQARCDTVIAYLKSFTPDQINGSEDKDIVLKIGGQEMHFTGRSILFSFVLANVHFHSTMAYALLRGAGVDIGKSDYLGAR